VPSMCAEIFLRVGQSEESIAWLRDKEPRWGVGVLGD